MLKECRYHDLSPISHVTLACLGLAWCDLRRCADGVQRHDIGGSLCAHFGLQVRLIRFLGPASWAMLNERKRIEKLPEDTRTYLRSTQIVTSIPQIVSELVQNSLDAQAKHVDIGVNHEEWTCFVSDDGVGISAEGLSTLAKGGEDGRYGEHPLFICDLCRHCSLL
jgi:hypothetical protein